MDELKSGKKKKKDIEVSPILNFVVSTYYKGTGIETVLQKLEKYIDESNSLSKEVNNI